MPTFPEPTGPITATRSPGFILFSEIFWSVGNSITCHICIHFIINNVLFVRFYALLQDIEMWYQDLHHSILRLYYLLSLQPMTSVSQNILHFYVQFLLIQEKSEIWVILEFSALYMHSNYIYLNSFTWNHYFSAEWYGLREEPRHCDSQCIKESHRYKYCFSIQCMSRQNKCYKTYKQNHSRSDKEYRQIDCFEKTGPTNAIHF